jgi:hypothetical protein
MNKLQIEDETRSKNCLKSLLIMKLIEKTKYANRTSKLIMNIRATSCDSELISTNELVKVACKKDVNYLKLMDT